MFRTFVETAEINLSTRPGAGEPAPGRVDWIIKQLNESIFY